MTPDPDTSGSAPEEDTIPTATEDTPTPEADPQDAAKLRREAAGYRSKLRAAEAERDALTARLDRLQRGEVERLAAEQLARPEDLWLVAQPADLLGDEGDVDAEKVAARIAEIVTERPSWARPPVHVSFDGGARGPSVTGNGASWQGVLSGREQGGRA